MKSKVPPKGGGSHRGDPEKDLTVTQLAKLGAFAIQFNYMDVAIERCLFYAMNLPGEFWLDLAKRIGGIEKKTDMCRKGVRYFQKIITTGYKVPRFEFRDACLESFGAFNTCRTYRDLMVHSVIYNSSPAIGQRFGYSGEQGIEFALLEQKALNRIYEEATLVRNELELTERLLSLTRHAVYAWDPILHSKWQPSQEAQDCLVKLHKAQANRKSLEPFPKFPETTQEPQN